MTRTERFEFDDIFYNFSLVDLISLKLKTMSFFSHEKSLGMKAISVAIVKVALDGGTRPGDTLQIHPHFLSLMGDGQANAFRWRDTSPRAALSVVL